MASTSNISSTSGSLFSFGGLATGMDTNSIIDKLVQLETVPLTNLKDQQSAFKTQISLLGDLASRLEGLKSACADLGSGGVIALQTSSTNAAFSASPGSGAAAGSYNVQVGSLATAAKWRSAGLAPTDALQTGSLRLTVAGTHYPPDGSDPIVITGQSTLESIASAIRATGAPVSVSVLNDGTSKYLSITNGATGYTGVQADALKVVFTPEPPEEPLSALWTASYEQPATNASFTVDDLSFSRTSNTVSDAVPGTILTLKSGGGAAETLSIGYDAAGTQANLQKFVDAYNALISAVEKQMDVGQGTNRSTTLAGDSSVRSLQQALQSITSSLANDHGAVRSLADLGVKTNRDGTLSVDSTALSSAIARDPAGVDAVFSTATTGIAPRLLTLALGYSSSTGLLSMEQTSLRERVSSMDDQAAQIQARITAYHDQLVAQFAAMENLVSKFKTIGDYLTAQDNANSKK